MSNRNIFEEVETAEKPAATAGVIDRAAPTGARGAIRAWLMVIFALVCAMIIVGGLTRLTDSGLSITEWKPVTGAVPPMNDAAWQVEFDKYQGIPEFELVNHSMTMAEFKTIFWWEWGHRQLGRVVGLVWALGFFGFLAARKIPTGWTGRLLGLGALGGLQGAIGWWMVSSGLTGRMVDVASYRLATHLGLAFFILALCSWYIMLLGRSEADLLKARRGRDKKMWGLGTGLLHFTGLQILLGALVAGIDAGRGYIDWPLMAGQVIPDGMFDLTPWWSNFMENPALVQFIHRLSGYLLFVFAIVVWRKARKSGHDGIRRAFIAAFAMMLCQMIIGIVTVMNASPLHIAIFHQGGAIFLWVLVLRARFMAGYPEDQKIKGAA